MQLKTAAIVLYSMKYSDSAAIVTMYTEQFGRISYIVYGTHKKKSTLRAAFLQPFSLLELEVVHSPGRDLQQIKEARIAHSFSSLLFHPYKNALVLFLSELLQRSLHQTEPDELLYRFLELSILFLDECNDGLSNFHLVFMMRLTKFLGFYPNNDENSFIYFDLINGVFTNRLPQHSHFLKGTRADDMYRLLQVDYNSMNQLVFTRSQRVELLEALIEFYRLHLPDFHGLRSLEVMQALFD